MWLKRINLIAVGVVVATGFYSAPAFAQTEELSASFLAQISESLRGLELRLHDLLQARLLPPTSPTQQNEPSSLSEETIKSNTPISDDRGISGTTDLSVEQKTKDGLDQDLRIKSCMSGVGGEGSYVCTGLPTSGAGYIRVTRYDYLTGEQKVDECRKSSCRWRAQQNSTTTFEVFPNEGWQFLKWSYTEHNGRICEGLTNTTCLFHTGPGNDGIDKAFPVLLNSPRTLTLFKDGVGSSTITIKGTVTDSYGNKEKILCFEDCPSFSQQYNHQSSVDLTAKNSNSAVAFKKWIVKNAQGVDTGECNTKSTCKLLLDQNKTVTVVFEAKYALLVRRSGVGNGSVKSGDGGTTIACEPKCSAVFSKGKTKVQLSALPSPVSTFMGWTGACSGTGDCSVTVNGSTEVGALFEERASTLLIVTLASEHGGQGTVTSNPVGIDCPTTCSSSFYNNLSVTLTATTTGTYSVFDGWTGDCAGNGLTCTVSMVQARNVTARFNTPSDNVRVVKRGTGNGSVESAPSGILCGTDCTDMYVRGTSVTFTATPSQHSVFQNWMVRTGAGVPTSECLNSTSPTCTIFVDQNKSVEAFFALTNAPLDVAKSGNGGGSVSSVPSGILCGTDCSEQFSIGTQVTLTATPLDSHSSFGGWTDACATESSPSCSFTITTPTFVGAKFVKNNPPQLSSIIGPATTTLSQLSPEFHFNVFDPDGNLDRFTVDWGDGSALFTHSPLSNNATYDLDHIFTSLGVKTVTVTLYDTRGLSVSETRQIEVIQNTYTLTIISPACNAGEPCGYGVITSVPTGIQCDTNSDTTGVCEKSFGVNTVVTLTATPDASSTFVGWNSGGPCASAGSSPVCTVTMDGNKNIGVRFQALPDLIVQSFSISPIKERYSRQNDTPSYFITVKNIGGYSIASTSVRIKNITAGNDVWSTTYPSLQNGEELYVTTGDWSFNDDYTPYGPTELRAVIDEDNIVSESNEQNNTKSLFININHPPEIVSLTVPTSVRVGETATATIVMRDPDGLAHTDLILSNFWETNGNISTQTITNVGTGNHVVDVSHQYNIPGIYKTGFKVFDGTDDIKVSSTIEVLPQMRTVTIQKNINNSGNGTILGDIICGLQCTSASSSFPVGATVHLTATPDASSTFVSWGGGYGKAGYGCPTITSNTNPYCEFVVKDTNNYLNYYIDPVFYSLPDLAVTQFSLTPVKPRYSKYDIASSTFKIKNIGGSDSGPFDIELKNTTTNTVIGGGSVSGIGPNNEFVREGTVPLNVFPYGNNELQIKADVLNTVHELNEQNNIATTSIYINTPPVFSGMESPVWVYTGVTTTLIVAGNDPDGAVPNNVSTRIRWGDVGSPISRIDNQNVGANAISNAHEHTYTQPGIYTVRYEITDQIDSATTTFQLEVREKPTLTITNPISSVTWVRGQSVTVSWNRGGYFPAGAYHEVILVDQFGNGYQLTDPVTSTNTTIQNISVLAGLYHFEVQTRDNSGNLLASSRTGLIVTVVDPPSVHVVSPNGGEVWYQGTTSTIMWEQSGYYPSGSHTKIGIGKGADGYYDIQDFDINPPSSTQWFVPFQFQPQFPNWSLGSDFKIHGLVTTPSLSSSDNSDVSFTIAPSPANIVKNNTGSLNIAPGGSSQKIGSYIINAVGTGIILNTFKVQMAGNVSAALLSNLYLMINGAQFGSSVQSVQNGATYAFTDTTASILAGSSIFAELYADVGATAPPQTIDALTSVTGCDGLIQINIQSFTCNPAGVTGQSVAILPPPKLMISGSPANDIRDQVVPVGSLEQKFFAFNLTADNSEPIKITRLDFTAKGIISPTTLSHISLYEGLSPTPFASAAQFDTCTTNQCLVGFAGDNLLSAPLPAGGTRTIFVKANVQPGGSGGILGDNFKFEISNTGVAGKGASHAGAAQVTGSAISFGKTYIVPQNVIIEAVPISPTAGTTSGQVVGKFKIINHGTKPIYFSSIPGPVPFKFKQGGYAVSSLKFDLYASGQGSNSNDTSILYSSLVSAFNNSLAFSLGVIPENDRRINPGSWRYLTIKTNGVAQNNNTVQLSVDKLGDINYVVKESELGYDGNGDNDMLDTITDLFLNGTPSGTMVNLGNAGKTMPKSTPPKQPGNSPAIQR